jgi:hypothetical protein
MMYRIMAVLVWLKCPQQIRSFVYSFMLSVQSRWHYLVTGRISVMVMRDDWKNYPGVWMTKFQNFDPLHDKILIGENKPSVV